MSDGEKDRLGDKLRDVEKAREDTFFAERDRALLQRLKARTAVNAEQAVGELAARHCPKCGDRLTTSTQLEVEHHECPSRHGVWLDTGKLEKLMKRENSGWLARILGRPS